jgi:hypothetical protein
MILNQVG